MQQHEIVERLKEITRLLEQAPEPNMGDSVNRFIEDVRRMKKMVHEAYDKAADLLNEM